MNNYDNWAKLYDSIYGSRQNDIDIVNNLVKKHAPNAKTLLDIACGTGIITNGLSKQYEVEGLDLSKGLIDVAKEKYPQIPFHHANMTSFKLDKKFDAVLCLFNSINHLTDFEDWKLAFKSIKDHLNTGGIFIFDTNTVLKLNRLSEMRGAILDEFGDEHYRFINVTKDDDFKYSWNVKVFENLGDSKYVLHKDVVRELGVEKETILKELNNHFKTVTVLDRSGNVATDSTSVLYFICK